MSGDSYDYKDSWHATNFSLSMSLGSFRCQKPELNFSLRFLANAIERSSVILTSNLPFDEWTENFGSERLTGALLDRITHHVHILEINGESYRLKHSKKKKRGKRLKGERTLPIGLWKTKNTVFHRAHRLYCYKDYDLTTYIF